ncbi:MBL fold metallo-hydrolase [Paenibacillus sp. UNC451MF]|uniref:MBL fold metallo-hydrolase n=1 Tax=Paenibacillus sp. UNC451MF TaxID=1449063 RepID=UPI0004903652|nr:MBL fold metallo-hydrolase [Paenibacillus sp. UNC451MF]
MKLHFLGTAAAEGWPGLFCRCEHCNKAKQLGGKNIRTRSSVLIDDTFKVDFPPDSYYHMLRDNIDMAAVEHLFITHTHTDHLHAADLEKRSPVCAAGIDKPLHIYGHDLALQSCLRELDLKTNRYELHLIHPFRTVQVDEETRVTPLLADHDKRQTCLLYFIEKRGKALLYGNDSGWFPQETWDWLEGKSFDAAILDCTKGPLTGRRNHMNIEAILEINIIFQDKQMLRDQGRIIATHFSHNCGMLHEDLEREFNPHGILVAFDGMIHHL